MFKESKIPNFLFWLEVSDFRTITTINTKNNLQNICQNCFQISAFKTVVEPHEDQGRPWTPEIFEKNYKFFF